MALLIGLGFYEDNLVRLKQDPIGVRGDELEIAGTDFLVFYCGKTQDQFRQRFESLFKLFDIQKPEGRVSVMYVADSFYLTPIANKEKTLYTIGFSDKSLEKLRAGEMLTFRARLIEGDGDNIEVVMFWGKDEQTVKEQFAEFIGPTT